MARQVRPRVINSPCYTTNMTFTSLYIHIPFCQHRCGYCDFNTYAGLEELIPAYARAVCAELEYLAQSTPEQVNIHTIYFGGGTPSLMPAELLGEMLLKAKECFDLSLLPEVTLEANPGTLSAEYLRKIGELGINRLSLGMQTAHQSELALLGRQHSYSDVVQAVVWARKAGIHNLNLDLIFGFPGQGIEDWLSSLEAACSLQPQHLSLYALTLEHGTPLQHAIKRGDIPEPDPDLAADMYEAARERLYAAGFEHYEISNWAREPDGERSFTCQHNLQYWHLLPYLGIGAGAHGFINRYHTVNVASPRRYIHRLNHAPVLSSQLDRFPSTPATSKVHLINQETEIGEMMMMGLRLVQEGITSEDFEQRFGVPLLAKFSHQIELLVSQGLLETAGVDAERIRLTAKGQLLGNRVFSEFI